jgi:hypothetical protein|tara:strand:- start:529 stop:1236 length:708 start_codon:yes stop_codon:yes gene_type:complete
MIDLQPYSQGAKTKGCATTYRSGENNPYATCPEDCPLKPEDWKGADEFDRPYMTALSKAVPKGGWAWTYSHFMPMLWKHLLGKGKTVINASASSRDQAAQYFKEGIPTVLDVPPDTPKNFVHNDVQFAVCPATLSKKMTCLNCGGPKGPLCARLDRKYVITFPWHGTVGALKKMVSKGKGICYGNSYHVNRTWNKFAKKSKHHLSDGEKLLAEVKLLPYHTRLRHHVVGDGGMDS